jgi:hypothetical protein
MRRSLLALLVIAAFSAAACDNSGTTATSPTVPLKSETFTGTIAVVGGSSTGINFTASAAGEVDVTISSLGPPATIAMGLALGVPSTVDTSCAITTGSGTQVQASATPLVSSVPSAGPYCLRLFDVGQMTGPINYTITVAHP